MTIEAPGRDASRGAWPGHLQLLHAWGSRMPVWADTVRERRSRCLSRLAHAPSSAAVFWELSPCTRVKALLLFTLLAAGCCANWWRRVELEPLGMLLHTALAPAGLLWSKQGKVEEEALGWTSRCSLCADLEALR